MSREMKKRGKRSGFTLIEIFVAMTILTILISVAMVGYQGYRDRVAVMVDETNQKVIQAALKLFTYDNNALPGSLSDLRPHDLHRAYALVTEGKQPYTMLAHLRLMWQETVGVDVAEAFLPGSYVNEDLRTFTCPKDLTPPTGFNDEGRQTGGVSYVLNPAAAGRPLSWLLDQGANGSVTLLTEGDVRGSWILAYRHSAGFLGGDEFAVSINVLGEHGKVKKKKGGPGKGKGGGHGGGGGDDDDDDDDDDD